MGGSAVQEAGGKSAQTAVAQRCVLDILQVGKLHAALGEARLHILQDAQGEQVVVDQAAHQILGGEVQRAALLQAHGVVVGPLGRDGLHHRVGHALVELYGAGLLKAGVILAPDDGLGGLDDLRRVQLSDVAAVVAAVQHPQLTLNPGEVGGLHAPQPVAAHGAGEVHAGLAAQTQQILHGDDGGVGIARPGGAQQRGNDIVVLLGHAQLLAGKGLHGGLRIRPPAQRGVVVVGAGVDDAVFLVVLRQILTAVVAVEGELENLHARIAAGGLQLQHALAQHAQILSHDLQLGQLLLYPAEQLAAGGQLVLTVAGGSFLGGDGVVVGEADEVVDAQDVEHAAQRAQALDPPGKPGFLVLLPGVQRVAPALAVLLEVIRRHARDADRAHVVVQLE